MKTKVKPMGVSKAGAIVSIVFSVIFFIAFMSLFGTLLQDIIYFNSVTNGVIAVPDDYWVELFLYLTFALLQVLTLVFAILYLKNENYKTAAGIISLIFTGLIGGILILAGKRSTPDPFPVVSPTSIAVNNTESDSGESIDELEKELELLKEIKDVKKEIEKTNIE